MALSSLRHVTDVSLSRHFFCGLRARPVSLEEDSRPCPPTLRAYQLGWTPLLGPVAYDPASPTAAVPARRRGWRWAVCLR